MDTQLSRIDPEANQHAVTGSGKPLPRGRRISLPLVREVVTDENAGLRKQVPVEMRAGRKRAEWREKKRQK